MNNYIKLFALSMPLIVSNALSQYQTLSEVSDQLEDAGVQNSIIKNAQDIQKRLMNGIGKEGDKDYKMGSIEAATILKTRGVDKDEREKLNEIITKANSNLKTTTKTAGIISSLRYPLYFAYQRIVLFYQAFQAKNSGQEEF